MIEVPGKTFLLGEYAALAGGPSIIFCQKPYFTAELTGHGAFPFHPDSPAGQYAKAHNHFPSIVFKNPYQPKGGLGSSTAEFLMTFLALHPHPPLDIINLKAAYLALFKDNCPSGADVIAQALGGLVVQCPTKETISLPSWPFDDLSLVLIHTEKKLATHEHLSRLEKTLSFNSLFKPAQKGINAIFEHKAHEFIASINDAAFTLMQLGLVASHSQTLLTEFKKQAFILAAKGCGAMGADIIALFCKKEDKKKLLGYLESKSCIVMATESSLSKVRSTKKQREKY